MFFVSADPAGAQAAPVWAAKLRKAGIACELDPRGGKLARQFKQAERVRARYAVVLGGNEVASGEAKLKELATGNEVSVRLDTLAAHLRSS